MCLRVLELTGSGFKVQDLGVWDFRVSGLSCRGLQAEAFRIPAAEACDRTSSPEAFWWLWGLITGSFLRN